MENTKLHSNPKGQTDLFGGNTIDATFKLFDKLEKPLIKANQMGIVKRNLSHWVKVLGENTTGNNQKKYSFIEFVWLKLVEQLRALNIGFDTIKAFRSNLQEPVNAKGIYSTYEEKVKYIKALRLNKKKESELLKVLDISQNSKAGNAVITHLHLSVMDNLINKEPITFYIFSDGSYLINCRTKNSAYSETELHKMDNEPFVVISIARVMNEFLYSELSGLVVPAIGLLSYGENKLFEVLYTGDLTTITIQFTDKNIPPVELKKSATIKKQVIDIISTKQFEEIIVKKSKGVITKIDRTIKVVL